MSRKGEKHNYPENPLPHNVSWELKELILAPKKVQPCRSADELTQVERILLKFGGALALQRALIAVGHYHHIATIYRWRHGGRYKGIEGVLPVQRWPEVFKAALSEGIILTSEDVDPRPRALKNFEEKRLIAFPIAKRGRPFADKRGLK